MNRPLVCLFAALLIAAPCARAQSYLDSTTHVLTTNAASRAITVTNWPASGSAQYAWYPSAILLNNRGSTTGELLRVEHVRLAVSNGMVTNGPVNVTNLLVSISSGSADSTNWVAPARWYVAPTSDQLRISSVCTNAELILFREVAQ